MDQDSQELDKIAKLLGDKSRDKQDQGKKDIEKRASLAAQRQNDHTIRFLIDFYRNKYVTSTQTNNKKIGMLALCGIAAGLIKENPQMAERYVKSLTSPMLENFKDLDYKSRFAAVEHLDIMCKTLKTMILINLNELFEAIATHISDSNENMQGGLCQLDNQLKQFVGQAVSERILDPIKTQYFNLPSFIDTLQKNMKTKNAQIRTVITSWIKTLNSCHNNDLYMYFPKLLDGLFSMLGENNKEIRSAADLQVIEFLKQVEAKSNYDLKVNEAIIEILVKICNLKGNNYAKLNALLWIFEYLRVFNMELEEDGMRSKALVSTISYKGQNTSPELSRTLTGPNGPNLVETVLRKTILNKLSSILEPILLLLSHEEEEIRKAALKTNELLLKIMERIKNESVEFINIVPIVKEMLTEKKSSTAESALIWMRHLLEIYSDKLLPIIEDILAKLIDRLNDAESTVVQNVMDVLANISMHSQYFEIVIDKILNSFHRHKELHQNKGELILKKLCSLLNPQKVYFTITAKLLEKNNEHNVEFISDTVKTLTTLLIQEKELQSLRQVLRNLKHENDEKRKNNNQEIFETLYQTFCYNPMSAITLCLLSEEYELAYNIIVSFAEVEVNEEILREISQLINVLESPVFVFLRLQLLDHENHPYLVKCLFGLMMLLPQGPAFKKLKSRLKNIQKKVGSSQDSQALINGQDFIDIKKLLTLFKQIRLNCIYQGSKQEKDSHYFYQK